MKSLWIALPMVLLCACTPTTPLLGNPQLPYPPAATPQVGDILHLRTGHYVNATEMAAAATDSRIVYVAETHDNPASHRVQFDLLRTLAQRYPGRTAIAMEMFTPAQQASLDAWVAQELDEKSFLKTWYSSWKMDIAYYREILDYCRAAGIPVLGINAEKSLIQAVARKDFAELSTEEQARLPATLDMDDPYHQALTAAIFGGHAQGTRLAGFQRVQTLWDETMAENIVRFLASPQGDDFHLLVLAGGNHVRNGFGIPRRVFRQLPLSYTLIGNEELDVSEAKKREAYMDVTLPQFPMPAFDYLVFTRYEELEKPEEVKLGIMFKEEEGRVVVTNILPNGVAALAGVLKGDILRSLDGEAIVESFDLIYALQQKKIGDKGQLTVERNGETLVLDLTYAPAPPVEGGTHKP
ncbi:MAG: ChaN family lipoprotein [Desulfuromonadales bacterium]|nr:ChaN family lipoprotein [Desulfuromonadales bacterium]